MLEKDFKETIVNIKNEIINTQTQILSDANGRLINLYFKLGKIINDNSKWGDKFIETLELELKLDFPNVKGFSARNLRRMKRFYLEYKDEEILPPAVAKLSWTHNIILLEKIKDKQIRFWYANEAANSNWSKVVLDHQIDMNLYERKALTNKSNNFKNTLVEPQSDLANDLQKDPYIFNLPLLKEKYVEKELEESMIERIRDVLLELGNGFSFIGSEYKITVGNNDYFIDMLFYHLKLHCYIVVELKTIPFKPEFIGQLNFYLTALDEQIKDNLDAPTIGLLLCKGKDKLTVEYSLKGVDKPIGVSSYKISKYLPKDVLESLPTEEDINLHIDIKEESEEYMDVYQKRKMRKENKNNKNETQGGFKKSVLSWYPGHMVKTKREIKERLDLIDVVFELIDARIPSSSKNKEVDELTKGKKKIIIMTKTDLCDEYQTNKWCSYYESLGISVIKTNLLNNFNPKEIFSLTDKITKEINDKRIEKGLKPRRIRALIIGVPNVGKSTLINRLVHKKATKVGNKPGITKNLEWIRISDKLELLDTPGILWPRLDGENVAYNLAAMTSIKEEVINISEVACYIIEKMLKLYPENIISRYNLTNTSDIIVVLDAIAKKLGAYNNNDVNYERVYDAILRDLRDGRLGRVTFDRMEE